MTSRSVKEEAISTKKGRIFFFRDSKLKRQAFATLFLQKREAMFNVHTFPFLFSLQRTELQTRLNCSPLSVVNPERSWQMCREAIKEVVSSSQANIIAWQS